MAGVISNIKDFVVYAQFDDDMPEPNELVNVGNGHGTQLLVDHLNPGGIALCLNIRSDLRLTKGMPVERARKGVEVPVG
ncbi:MAG: hypothetical protein ACREJM_06710, partial [Candidatus Saccharimonadales bacterium]